jgi:uncharacterized protein (DUF58 family)
LLSDFIDQGWENPLSIALARHDVVALRATDPAELELPNLGLLELVDAETGASMLVDSSSKKVREAYKKKRELEQAAVKKKLGQLGCDLVDLFTDRDYVAPLVSFMRTRSRRLRAGR